MYETGTVKYNQSLALRMLQLYLNMVPAKLLEASWVRTDFGPLTVQTHYVKTGFSWKYTALNIIKPP